MNLHRTRPLALLLGLALIAGACSDDNTDNDAGTEPPTTTVVANPPTDDGGTDGDDSAATAQESVELEVGEYTFDAVVAGPDDGAVVFLLHGFPQTNQSWDEVVPAMAEAGYRGVAPNLRGYSPGARPPEPELYTMDLLTADVVTHGS